MALSNWNCYLNRKLAVKLNGTESRLLDALARKTLGYNKPSVTIGDRQLQELACIDRRNLSRSRQRLIHEGLITYKPGHPGRGGICAIYVIELDETNSVSSRALDTRSNSVNSRSLENRAISRGKSPVNQRKQIASIRPKQIASPDAHLKGRVKSTGKPPNQELVGRVIENYSANGGNLEREGWRSMLAKHTTQLLKAGNEVDLIVTAAGLLARDGDGYPGNLTKLVKQIQTEGMPCKHRGDLRGLSKALLTECGCPACLDRIAYCEAHGLDTAFLDPLL